MDMGQSYDKHQNVKEIWNRTIPVTNRISIIKSLQILVPTINNRDSVQ